MTETAFLTYSKRVLELRRQIYELEEELKASQPGYELSLPTYFTTDYAASLMRYEQVVKDNDARRLKVERLKAEVNSLIAVSLGIDVTPLAMRLGVMGLPTGPMIPTFEHVREATLVEVFEQQQARKDLITTQEEALAAPPGLGKWGAIPEIEASRLWPKPTDKLERGRMWTIFDSAGEQVFDVYARDVATAKMMVSAATGQPTDSLTTEMAALASAGMLFTAGPGYVKRLKQMLDDALSGKKPMKPSELRQTHLTYLRTSRPGMPETQVVKETNEFMAKFRKVQLQRGLGEAAEDTAKAAKQLTEAFADSFGRPVTLTPNTASNIIPARDPFWRDHFRYKIWETQPGLKGPPLERAIEKQVQLLEARQLEKGLVSKTPSVLTTARERAGEMPGYEKPYVSSLDEQLRWWENRVRKYLPQRKPWISFEDAFEARQSAMMAENFAFQDLAREVGPKRANEIMDTIMPMVRQMRREPDIRSLSQVDEAIAQNLRKKFDFFTRFRLKIAEAAKQRMQEIESSPEALKYHAQQEAELSFQQAQARMRAEVPSKPLSPRSLAWYQAQEQAKKLAQIRRYQAILRQLKKAPLWKEILFGHPVDMIIDKLLGEPLRPVADIWHLARKRDWLDRFTQATTGYRSFFFRPWQPRQMLSEMATITEKFYKKITQEYTYRKAKLITPTQPLTATEQAMFGRRFTRPKTARGPSLKGIAQWQTEHYTRRWWRKTLSKLGLAASSLPIIGLALDLYYGGKEALRDTGPEPLTLDDFGGDEKLFRMAKLREQITSKRVHPWVAVGGLADDHLDALNIQFTMALNETHARMNLGPLLLPGTILYDATGDTPQELIDEKFPDDVIRMHLLGPPESKWRDVAAEMVFTKEFFEREAQVSRDLMIQPQIKLWANRRKRGVLRSRVTKVLSGNSFMIEDSKFPILLRGVRIPEGGEPPYTGASEREALEKMILDRVVRVHITRTSEDKTMKVAKVYFENGVSVNKEMVAKGGAVSSDSYTRDPNKEYPFIFYDPLTREQPRIEMLSNAPPRKDADIERGKYGLVRLPFIDTANPLIINWRVTLEDRGTGELSQVFVRAHNYKTAYGAVVVGWPAKFKERITGQELVRITKLIKEIKPIYTTPPFLDQPPTPDKAVLDRIEKKKYRQLLSDEEKRLSITDLRTEKEIERSGKPRQDTWYNTMTSRVIQVPAKRQSPGRHFRRMPQQMMWEYFPREGYRAQVIREYKAVFLDYDGNKVYLPVFVHDYKLAEKVVKEMYGDRADLKKFIGVLDLSGKIPERAKDITTLIPEVRQQDLKTEPSGTTAWPLPSIREAPAAISDWEQDTTRHYFEYYSARTGVVTKVPRGEWDRWQDLPPDHEHVYWPYPDAAGWRPKIRKWRAIFVTDSGHSSELIVFAHLAKEGDPQRIAKMMAKRLYYQRVKSRGRSRRFRYVANKQVGYLIDVYEVN